MDGHTLGRLVYDPDNVGAVGGIGTPDRHTVAQVQAYLPGQDGLRQREVDAKRIIACWNACEFLTTEALEADVVRKLVEALADLCSWETELTQDKWDYARAILTLAKGEAA